VKRGRLTKITRNHRTQILVLYMLAGATRSRPGSMDGVNVSGSREDARYIPWANSHAIRVVIKSAPPTCTQGYTESLRRRPLETLEHDGTVPAKAMEKPIPPYGASYYTRHNESREDFQRGIAKARMRGLR
jgi:hypothetical protein